MNPSVPMALRLSGILMGEFDFVCVPSIYPRIFGMGFDVLCCARNERAGGVVIVYERKVKLLYGNLFPLFAGFFFTSAHAFAISN